MSVEMDQLKVDVAAETTVAGSVIAYIQGLAPQIADAAGDRAASKALSIEVKNTAAAMAAAILQNTPAALADEYNSGAEFDTAAAAYKGSDAVNKDGVEVHQGTAPATEYYSHSATGKVNKTPPTD